MGLVHTQAGTTYDMADSTANEHDVAEAFCKLSIGSTILFRAGVRQEAVGNTCATQTAIDGKYGYVTGRGGV